ncbi:TolC family protein [Rubrivirga litoralis]|uniref:TolC family protein n=1 Tax=Rubrivirga litoralis TaxID=3075598 RepID=A0ABU3BNC8_9BACT|nr:TolC family protein [Rubrivirga sp. F394]MDT0630810.1 TolC family protein [Rubrivirga sp. F394]
MRRLVSLGLFAVLASGAAAQDVPRVPRPDSTAAVLPDSGAVPINPPEPTGPAAPLSLEAAVARALSESEEVELARSQVDLAETQVDAAYAQLFPQVSANLGYQRTLASQFDTGNGLELPDSLQFRPDPTAPLEERVSYLEQNASSAAFAALGGLFEGLPFGQENAYSASLSGSQVLFAPQAFVGTRIAKGVREAVTYNEVEEVADVRLQVEQAYIQALVAQELVGISQAAIEQAQAFLDEERLRLRAGRASELEVLRAEVDLENLRPQQVQAQNAADLAVLNLKRLANVPYDQPVVLTTDLTLPPSAALADVDIDPAASTAQRAAILAAQAQVGVREQQVRLQKAAYLPSVALTTNYGQTLFPSSIFAFDGDPRTDWTVSLGVQIPIFDGFRRRAQVAEARVELLQAELQRDQLVEAVQLQVEQALREKRRAAALIAARQTTVDQAARVYRLTDLQYREGLATQLEVSNARLGLLQARSNLVQALANFYTADTDLARSITDATGTPSPFSMGTGQPLADPADAAPPAPSDTVPGTLTPTDGGTPLPSDG